MSTTTSEANNLFHGLVISRKHCSGKCCTKIGKNLLLISFIRKTGYFCDECAYDLLAAGLAVRLEEASEDD